MSAVNRLIGKHELVSRLLAAKEASGKTFTQISKEVGLTNVYTAQLFYNQVIAAKVLQHVDTTLIAKRQCKEAMQGMLRVGNCRLSSRQARSRS